MGLPSLELTEGRAAPPSLAAMLSSAAAMASPALAARSAETVASSNNDGEVLSHAVRPKTAAAMTHEDSLRILTGTLLSWHDTGSGDICEWDDGVPDTVKRTT